MRISLTLAVLLVGCGGSNQALQPHEPKGYAAHMAEADAHDRDAQTHERASAEAAAAIDPSAVKCGNPVVSTIADQTTSGGERIGSWVPCWTVERQAAERHHAEAVRLREQAHVDRAIARNLVAVEREFCAVMPPDELTHTPFWHREDIATVEPYLEEGVVHGARVRFKAVEGLTGAWLREAILCHQARSATLGHPPTYMDYDPTLVAGVHVVVTEKKGLVEVLVRADDGTAGAVVVSRAQALLTRPIEPPPPPPAPTTH